MGYEERRCWRAWTNCPCNY